MARWRRYFVRAAVASHALFVAAALGMVEFGRQRRIDIAIQGRGDRPVRSLRWLESLEWGTLCWCGALGGVAALGWTFWVSERVRDRGAGYSGAAIWGSGLMLACAFWTASAFIVDIDHRATADFPRYAQYWASFDTLNQVRNTRGSLLVVALLTWLFCILRAMRGPARAEGPQKAKLIGSCAFMLTGIAIQIQAQSWDEDTDTWLQPPPPGVAVVDGYDQPSLETCVRPRYDNSDTAPQRLYVRSGGPVHWEGTEMSDEQLDRFLAWNRDRSLWGHAPARSRLVVVANASERLPPLAGMFETLRNGGVAQIVIAGRTERAFDTHISGPYTAETPCGALVALSETGTSLSEYSTWGALATAASRQRKALLLSVRPPDEPN
ncbi:MAG: hypothetical protein OXU20_33705 [Myxococcales bacterium]|nr:hypothetical protein [Myxococcales bacterium]